MLSRFGTGWMGWRVDVLGVRGRTGGKRKWKYSVFNLLRTSVPESRASVSRHEREPHEGKCQGERWKRPVSGRESGAGRRRSPQTRGKDGEGREKGKKAPGGASPRNLRPTSAPRPAGAPRPGPGPPELLFQPAPGAPRSAGAPRPRASSAGCDQAPQRRSGGRWSPKLRRPARRKSSRILSSSRRRTSSTGRRTSETRRCNSLRERSPPPGEAGRPPLGCPTWRSSPRRRTSSCWCARR